MQLGKLFEEAEIIFFVNLPFKGTFFFKGSDRLCMVVELSMQYCGQTR